MIEIWQANVHGKYNHPEDLSDAELVKGFNGFGRSCTDDKGCFFFVTLKPGRVAGRGNTLQAPHLAANVFAWGMLKQQVTRIYFSDEKKNNVLFDKKTTFSGGKLRPSSSEGAQNSC